MPIPLYMYHIYNIKKKTQPKKTQIALNKQLLNNTTQIKNI